MDATAANVIKDAPNHGNDHYHIVWHRLWFFRVVILMLCVVAAGDLASFGVIVWQQGTAIKFFSHASASDPHSVMSAYAAMGPVFYQVQAAIMLVTMTLLILLIAWPVRHLRHHVRSIVKGMNFCQGSDRRFCIDPATPYELKLIVERFNRLVEEEETSYRKRLYQEKMSSWQGMARKFAQEIKSPIAPVSMAIAQVIEEYKGEDSSYRELLMSVQQAINGRLGELRQLVDDFSEFVHIPEPAKQKCDLISLCDQVVRAQLVAFPHHDITFVTGLTEANVMVDPQLWKQMLMNLTKNAAEACGISSQSSVTLALTCDSDGYHMHCIDNGSGISPQIGTRIFDAFFTTKYNSSAPNMGLGLNICQKIVMAHDGDLSYVSTVGHTDFHVQVSSP